MMPRTPVSPSLRAGIGPSLHPHFPLDSTPGAARLTFVGLEGLRISDLSWASEFTNATRLDLRDNDLTDLAPLLEHDALRSADVRGSPLSRESVDIHIPKLRDSGVQVLYDEPVSMPDSNLYKAVIVALGGPEGRLVWQREFGGVFELHAPRSGIGDLRGLEHAALLRILDLSRNAITDLTPITHLRRLTHLYLAGNGVLRPDSLAGLRIRFLDLSWNPLSDVSPLQDLPLYSLSLAGNRIADLEPLSELRSLAFLDLSTNGITSISWLKSIMRLYSLDLSGNRIRNLTPFRELPRMLRGSLRRLRLADNRISDISPLAHLSLEELDLSENGIGDLAAVENMSDLTELRLADNDITDVTPLAELMDLQVLDLANNRIRDIGPLLRNPGLNRSDKVYLQGNPLDRTSIDVHIPALRERGVLVHRVGVSVSIASAREGEPLKFAVRLSAAALNEVRVNWRTLPGSATEDEDYPSGQAGTVAIPAGRTEALFEVATSEDDDREPHETIRVELSAPFAEDLPVGVALGAAGGLGLIVDANGDATDVPVLAPAGHATRQGFVRIVNRAGRGAVHIDAFDDAGNRRTTTLAVGAGRTVHFNSDDLERGNAAKGLLRGIGEGTGDWRLEVRGNGLDVLTFMRTRDGFMTCLHDLVPAGDGDHRVPIFNSRQQPETDQPAAPIQRRCRGRGRDDNGRRRRRRFRGRGEPAPTGWRRPCDLGRRSGEGH